MRDDEGRLQRLVFGVAGFFHELLRRGDVVFQLKAGLAEPRARRIDLALGRFGQTVHQANHRVAVDREIERLAQADVGPGRTRQNAQMIIPDMRRDVVDDLHAGGFELRHRIRRRRLDQIDLAGQQRIGARQRFRHRDQHDLVRLRNSLFVPIVGVLGQLGEFARHQFCEFERPGAGSLAGELVPVLAEFFVLRRARDQEPEHLVGKEGVDRFGGDLDGGIVDFAVARHRRQAGLHLRALALVELRRLVVQHLVEIPDHRIGVELAAVMEFHALAQREFPLLLVGIIDLPLGGKAWDQFAGPVGDIHFPGYQRIVDRVGRELIGAGAAVRLARGQRNIGHRDAIAHHRFGLRGEGGQAEREHCGGKKHRVSAAHELSSVGRFRGCALQTRCQNRQPIPDCMPAHKELRRQRQRASLGTAVA